MTPNRIQRKRKQNAQVLLRKLRTSLTEDFVKRVTSGEKTDEVLADVNRRWCMACDNAKMHPATKELLVRDIDALLETTNAVARRMRTERIVYRVVTAIILTPILAGLGVVCYGAWKYFSAINF